MTRQDNKREGKTRQYLKRTQPRKKKGKGFALFHFRPRGGGVVRKKSQEKDNKNKTRQQDKDNKTKTTKQRQPTKQRRQDRGNETKTTRQRHQDKENKA